MTYLGEMDLALRVLEGELAIVRLPPNSPIPPWLALSGRPLASVTATEDEISIVCPAVAVPDGVQRESGWRAFRVEGRLNFSLTGVLAAVVSPLADAGISAYSLSTYDTDFVLVRGERLDQAIAALSGRFHILVPSHA